MPLLSTNWIFILLTPKFKPASQSAILGTLKKDQKYYKLIFRIGYWVHDFTCKKIFIQVIFLNFNREFYPANKLNGLEDLNFCDA